jgi:plastocyanin domain-containing protein
MLVILAGVASIAWVNWYFLMAGRQASEAVVGASGLQEVRIRVAGGYDPAHVRVRPGPVRLIFHRQETSGCSEEVVMPDLGIRRYLPAHEETVIEFTPERAGRYEFTCGMSMLRGSVTVTEEEGS